MRETKKCLNLDSDYVGNADKCVPDSGGGWVFLVHLHPGFNVLLLHLIPI